MEFLVDNPQVWTGATPESGWVSKEQSHLGKDTTWRKLSLIPGMENHSYKSWREYHRARSGQVDKVAKEKRLAREAQMILPQPTPPPPPPSLTLTTSASIIELARKRSREPDDDMELSTPSVAKRNKLTEDESMISVVA